MTGYKLFLASVLLSAPADSISVPDAGKLRAELAPELRLIALQWQLIDAKDLKSTFVNPDTFLSELKALQNWNETLINAPWLDECGRFPNKDAVGELILANRVYRSEIVDRLALSRIHQENLQTVIGEIDQLFRAWDALRDALSEHYGVTYRRQALQTLRELIGAPAFYRGEMPPALPIWRFARN